MVDDESTKDLITWTGNGDQFTVFNNTEFSRVVLPRYFKHCNWSSFVRQLNMYDFHKITDNNEANATNDEEISEVDNQAQRWDFKHPWFNKSNIDSLHKIRRKPPRNRLIPQIRYSKAMEMLPNGSSDPEQDTASSPEEAHFSLSYIEDSPPRGTNTLANTNVNMNTPVGTSALVGMNVPIGMNASVGIATHVGMATPINTNTPAGMNRPVGINRPIDTSIQSIYKPPRLATPPSSSQQEALSYLKSTAGSLEQKLDQTSNEVHCLKRTVLAQQKMLEELLCTVEYLKTQQLTVDGMFENKTDTQQLDGSERRKPRKIHELLGNSESQTMNGAQSQHGNNEHSKE
ncbi:HSF-type DNA-binding-domain-containing protein [Gilbertella persicaria]|uniref:HSF-type DNA-binding-domain-containing protein n=1 Tax=Gilbertella persicaria TaxID=101096 RepID=UPI00221EE899|nr:HSF-type DNA-binding-domain-containing protein [Gilbertella persicaria]KAI8087943.1 HSF-type DNA-binding-domain-containing protein [Gilbertella persicaria]